MPCCSEKARARWRKPDARGRFLVANLGVGEPTVVVDERVDDVDAVEVAAVLASAVAGETVAPGRRKRTYSLLSMCSRSAGPGHS
jgi:hypothetical protein